MRRLEDAKARIHHGTWTAYNHLGCRCDLCRAKAAERSRAFQRKLKEDAAAAQPIVAAPSPVRYVPVAPSERLFLLRSVESGETAIIVTTPYKIPRGWKFSLKHWRVVRKRQRTRNK